MSLNLNKVILAGRIVADPELKQTQNGVALVSFRLAVNRRFGAQQNEADFFNVTAWRNTAEFIAKYFRKGSAICICGSIQNRTWTDQQGVKHYMTDIIAEEANFVENRSTQDSVGGGDFAPTPAFSSPAASAPKFEEIATEEDLPF